MVIDSDGIRYGPVAANDTDYRIFNAKRLCSDGCPPCKGCGVHIDSWRYFLNGGYCSACSHLHEAAKGQEAPGPKGEEKHDNHKHKEQAPGPG